MHVTQSQPFSFLNGNGNISRRSFLSASAYLGIGGLALGGLAACGGSKAGSSTAGSAAPSGPFTLGWIQPTTGLYAAGYAPIYVSGEIAVEEINAAGGI